MTGTLTLPTPTAPPRTRLRDLPAKMRPTDPAKMRLAALRRFAVAIMVLNIVGHLFLGFEQTIAQMILVVLMCYLTEIALETLVAKRDARRPAYLSRAEAPTRRERVLSLVNFLLPAHISGFALAMLLFISDRLDLFIVAAVVTISSKYIFRVRTGRGDKHFFNPSNFGITVMLVLYASTVSIAPPYQFTENLGHFGDIALPAFLACLGLFINFIFTGKLPLIFAWIGGFTAQAALRAVFTDDTSFLAAMSPLTGMALLLFTLYMITDPGTTPRSTSGQIMFGLSVAAVYGVLMLFHVAFGVFFALTIVSACRGAGLWIAARRESSTESTEPRIGGTPPTIAPNPVP
ncbi:enediyne biosynthesis protein UnbU [Verrucosispora sp. NA02020]|uniref:enediyne biosynthesis protein UnbU n=1 Tax=Verrucosispora sp. NA02020 TaxID=2742132 RepID=UPI003D7346EC